MYSANGLGLGDVPALAFHLLKFINKVDKYSFVQHLFLSRHIGKRLLAAGNVFNLPHIKH
jgi:hypothetical protein